MATVPPTPKQMDLAHAKLLILLNSDPEQSQFRYTSRTGDYNNRTPAFPKQPYLATKAIQSIIQMKARVTPQFVENVKAWYPQFANDVKALPVAGPTYFNETRKQYASKIKVVLPEVGISSASVSTSGNETAVPKKRSVRVEEFPVVAPPVETEESKQPDAPDEPVATTATPVRPVPLDAPARVNVEAGAAIAEDKAEQLLKQVERAQSFLTPQRAEQPEIRPHPSAKALFEAADLVGDSGLKDQEVLDLMKKKLDSGEISQSVYDDVDMELVLSDELSPEQRQEKLKTVAVNMSIGMSEKVAERLASSQVNENLPIEVSSAVVDDRSERFGSPVPFALAGSESGSVAGSEPSSEQSSRMFSGNETLPSTASTVPGSMISDGLPFPGGAYSVTDSSSDSASSVSSFAPVPVGSLSVSDSDSTVQSDQPTETVPQPTTLGVPGRNKDRQVKYHKVPIAMFFKSSKEPEWNNELENVIRGLELETEVIKDLLDLVIGYSGPKFLVKARKSEGDVQELVEVMELHFRAESISSGSQAVMSVQDLISLATGEEQPVDDSEAMPMPLPPVSSQPAQQVEYVGTSPVNESTMKISEAYRDRKYDRGHPLDSLTMRAMKKQVAAERMSLHGVFDKVTLDKIDPLESGIVDSGKIYFRTRN